MHRALRLEEVRTSIFDHLVYREEYSNDDYPSARQLDLLSTSLVCRDFVTAAMLVLWRVLPSFEAVLFLLAHFRVVKVSSDDTYARYNRNPTPAQWDRIEWYTRLIQRLRVYRATGSMMDKGWMLPEGFIGNLLKSHADRHRSRVKPAGTPNPLFPGLRALSFTGKTGADVLNFQLLLGNSPPLVELSYGPPYEAVEDSVKERCLQELVSKSKSLKSLMVTGQIFWPAVRRNSAPARWAKHLASAVSQSDLESVLFPDHVLFVDSVLKALATSPSIRTITFSPLLEENPSETQRIIDLPETSFPSLEVLRGTFNGLYNLWACIPILPKVQIVDLAHYKHPDSGVTWEMIRKTVDTVASSCPSLVSFILNITMDKTSKNEAAGRKFVLLPLQYCRNLTNLSLTIRTDVWVEQLVPDDFNATDADWKLLVDSWPNISRLVLDLGAYCTKDGWGPPPKPTPNAGVPTYTLLLTACKHLKVLCIPLHLKTKEVLDIAISPLAPIPGKIPPRNTTMERIDAGRFLVDGQSVPIMLAFWTMSQGILFTRFTYPSAGDLVLGPRWHRPVEEDELRRCVRWQDVPGQMKQVSAAKDFQSISPETLINIISGLHKDP